VRAEGARGVAPGHRRVRQGSQPDGREYRWDQENLVAPLAWRGRAAAQGDERLPYADLNGAHAHFTDTGGDGEAIVFSHGLLLSGAMFDEQIAHFRGRYRCIAFGHRGQGRSGVTEDGYDIDTLTADAAALIERLGLAPCHFVELSMGGFVGMQLAAQKPDLLKTLTLLDTSADPEPSGDGPKYRTLNFAARWIGPWAVVGSVMPILFGRGFLNDTACVMQRKRWMQAISPITASA
jgi:pimeloyl-ACP methyl ester carboxylesterase